MVKRLAFSLSFLTHPIFLAYFGILIAVHWHFALSTKLAGRTESFFLIIFFLSLVVVPALGLMLLLKKYYPKELASLSEEERRVGILVMSVLYFFMALSFDTLFVDPILKVYLFSLGLTTLIGFVISRFRKVSFHMLGFGAITAFVLLLTRNAQHSIDFVLFSVVILGGIVGVSRLILNAHKPSEIYLGYSAGLISNFIYFVIVYGF